MNYYESSITKTKRKRRWLWYWLLVMMIGSVAFFTYPRILDRFLQREEEKKLSQERWLYWCPRSFQLSATSSCYYMNRDGIEYFFEIKTVKPNMDIFEKSKTKLLEWIARRRSSVKVFLAFPYNPYHPVPYARFTETGMMDHPNDFLIGDEYWDFIGGKDTFPQLLETFDEVGKEYKEKLQAKFKQIANEKISSY